MQLLRRRSAHLLISLLLLLLLHPLAALIPAPWNTRLTSALTTLVMLTAVWWTTGDHRGRIWAVALVCPPVLALWLRQEIGPFASLAWVLFCFYVIGRLFRTVMRRSIDTVDRILVAISLYLLMAISFAFLHLMVHGLVPDAYRFPTPPLGEGLSDMVYYSLVTMLTLGFGDIVPVHPFARMLTVVEAFIGAFFIAILIARLVSLGSDTTEEAEPGEG